MISFFLISFNFRAELAQFRAELTEAKTKTYVVITEIVVKKVENSMQKFVRPLIMPSMWLIPETGCFFYPLKEPTEEFILAHIKPNPNTWKMFGVYELILATG